MKKFIALMLALVMTFALCACGTNEQPSNQQASAQPTADTNTPADSELVIDAETQAKIDKAEYLLTLGYGGAVTNERHICATAFANWVSEQSDGRLMIKCYPSEILGTDTEMMEMCIMGNLDMTLNSSTYLNPYIPGIDVIGMPFLFSGNEQVDAFLDGEIGSDIVKDLPELAGIRCLAYWENGFRQITNNVRAINVPSDLNGLKLRAPENMLIVDTLTALGAEPSPFAFAELYLAMSQGTFDGQENPIANIYASKFYEIQKYCAMVNYTYTPLVMLINEAKLNSLPEDLQKILAEGAVKFGQEHRATVRGNQDAMIAEMEEKGMEFSYPDTAVFRDKCTSVYDKFRDIVGSDLMDKALEFVKNYK